MQEFDVLIDRRHSGSSKWDKYQGQDILPLWVADMDFRAPDFILDAIRQRLAHGVLGYGYTPPVLVDAALAWFARRFNWAVQPDWLVWLPGVVPGLNLAARASGQPGDGLLLNSPIYYPFLSVAGNAGQQSLCVPLNPAGWTLDLAAMAAAVRAFPGRVTSFSFCNPQNPSGRIYRREELLALGEFCLAHDLLICSDEIHCDLLLDSPAPHIPIASLSAALAQRSISLFAPNKTYNIPGESCALAVIPDPTLRSRFIAAKAGLVPYPTVLAMAAATAAYSDQSDWVARLNQYLAGNRDLVQRTLSALPGVQVNQVEATCLAWVDLRAWQLPDPVTHLERHGIGLSDGAQFGAPGYVRLNFGCPRSRLQLALDRFCQAVPG